MVVVSVCLVALATVRRATLLHCVMASNTDRKEHHEGPDAARRFERTLNRVIAVSKEELAKRELAYQKTRPGKHRPAKPAK